MLKITVSHDTEGATFAVAGRLVGPWVQELRRCWRSWTESEGDRRRPCRVDLRETTYIDAEGKALLSDMHRQGVSFHACGCMTRAIVEELATSRVSDSENSPATPDSEQTT